MAVVFKKELKDGLILLWDIEESEEELRSLVLPSDVDSIADIKNKNLRQERLAWRAALRELGVTDSVVYNRLGAPRLKESKREIGVAHTIGASVLILSNNPCAIDIESTERNFDRAASRFISPIERELSESNHPLFKPFMWCAKETLYKLSCRDALNFNEDLRVESIDFTAMEALGKIVPLEKRVELEIELFNRYIITYTTSILDSK